MQSSTLHISASNCAPGCSFQWKRQQKVLNFFPFKQNPCFRRISRPPTSLKTSFDFGFDLGEENLKKEAEPSTPTRLPVVIRKSDGVCRYFWDGNELKLVSVDGDAFSPCFDDFGDGCRRLFRNCGLQVRNFFLPREINWNYLQYVKWKFLHRVFSSAVQVLATQAMFRAIGIGYDRSLPSAAALNWVLKDGLGRLSRCIYTASLASAFDTNLKRVRFSTSVVFSLSIGVELMTPAFPQYFLLLASVANIAKQISLACYLATASAVHRSFAIADNLGEVSAKAQIQSVCFDNLGLMLAAVLNILLKSNPRLQAGLPFVVYPIFTAIDLYGIHQSLKYVHLQTLTKDRLEIIIDTWIQLGYVPSPAEVSKTEGINFFPTIGRRSLPIRIGSLNPKGQIPKLSMMAMRSLTEKDFYFICMEVYHGGFVKTGDQGILLCFREGACTADIIMGLLQACHIREELLCGGKQWEDVLKDCDSSQWATRDWFKLTEDCKQYAQRDMKLLEEKMLGLGWACKNVLLSTAEKTRFSFIAD